MPPASHILFCYQPFTIVPNGCKQDNNSKLIYEEKTQRFGIIQEAWISDGMSMGSAAAFMLTGPSTKITNLGAVKIVLGVKRFTLYIAFVMVFSLVTGLVVNLVL